MRPSNNRGWDTGNSRCGPWGCGCDSDQWPGCPTSCDDGCCDENIITLRHPPVYVEIASSLLNLINENTLIPMNYCDGISSTGVSHNLGAGTVTVTQTGFYRAFYSAASMVGGSSAIALSIDGNVVPNSHVPLPTAGASASSTRLLPLVAGQSLGIVVLDACLIPAVSPNGSNALLSLERID